jgi:hypothetical protein
MTRAEGTVQQLDQESPELRFLGGITTSWKRCWVSGCGGYMANHWRVPVDINPILEPLRGMVVIMLMPLGCAQWQVWAWPESSGLSLAEGSAIAHGKAVWP